MIRVLMVETDACLVSSVSRCLVQYGARVCSVESLELAVESVRKTPFAVVIIDSDLVGAADLEAFVGVPLVVTSSFLEPEHARRFAVRARVLRKPFTSAELYSVLCEEIGLRPAPSSLLDILCRGHAARSSFRLRVGGGEIVLEEGELVHATFAGTSGEVALVAILAHGGAVVRSYGVSKARSIDRPFSPLLLDALGHVEALERADRLRGKLAKLLTRSRRRRGVR